jgi:signal transduction histidine kinase
MNAPDPKLHIAVGRIDAAGRLVEGDARLVDLNARAGGAVGAPLAVSEIAGLARLARRLGIAIGRSLVIADGDDDLELWVSAEPEGDGARIRASGWRARAAWRPPAAGAERATDFARAGADWLWETDASLRITHVSPEALLDLGLDASALLGAPITRLFALAEGDEGEFPMLSAAAGQGTFDDQRAEVRGTGRFVLLSAAPQNDASGRFAGFAGSVRTIAEPPAVPSGEAVFPNSFGERLGSALREPLSRIIANADSMSAQVEGPLAPDYAGYAADIANAGRHLLGLVDDLADLAAVERKDFRTTEEPIDLADLARRAAGLLGVRAAESSVRIERPTFGDSLPARGEFRRALQVLVNLIGNAVRYSPPGGVVWVRPERDDDRMCVIVADQGKGIAEADHARIFEKFARVDPDEPGGSGLGLYISRKLARAMGGDITVDSAPGQGARFVFSLPGR